jgi:Fic family protein
MIGLHAINDRISYMTQLTNRQKQILSIVDKYENLSISDILEKLNNDISVATLNRDIAYLVATKYLEKTGKGRAIKYNITALYRLNAPIEQQDYFNQDPDERDIVEKFNMNLFDILQEVEIFSKEELKYLESLKDEYQNNIKSITETLYKKEIERLTIELSWKSSQIEGNTYSLLETEILLLENKVAEGKSQLESQMLVNHKDCLDFILKQKIFTKTLNLSLIEQIHSLLIKELNVSKNLRSRLVGITGTSYKPIDNIHQIKEAVEKMCELINNRSNGFEKALIAILFISYIQPFEDGNKRTGRMVGNALLISDAMCPLSYRSVNSLDYKKAMLIFYEKNNLSAFKELFLEQTEFAVKNYFR